MTPEERKAQAAHARAVRAELKAQERVLTCPKGHDCKVTLYVKADAWCKHGKMKEAKDETR